MSIPRSLANAVALRASFCCEYCKALAAYSPSPFVIEHILPISKGGLTNIDNLAYSCQGCNNYKYTFIEAIDPITGEVAPLFNPRIDDWKNHFFWDENFVTIYGQTAIGRATAERLKLNRAELLNIRRILHLIGEHPKT